MPLKLHNKLNMTKSCEGESSLELILSGSGYHRLKVSLK